VNEFNPSKIPPYISALVAELEQWIRAATAPGVSDAEGESYSLIEDNINAQLRALGWDATLADTGHWVPVPSGFTIINNPPDPHFCLQRCYQVPEGPAQWRHLWQEEREVRFTNWRAAYAFVFTYLAQEQAQLPRKRFCVRPPGTWGGDEYVATSADQAQHLHLNYWLSLGMITTQQAVDLQLRVFEHCGDSGFYCDACQHAPCKYSPDSRWPMPETPGWVGSSL
jgi:hypothetical protein